MSTDHQLPRSSFFHRDIPQVHRSTAVRMICLAVLIVSVVYFLVGQQKTDSSSLPLAMWYKAAQRIRRPIYINSDHGLCGSCPSDKHTSDAWQLTDLLAHVRPHNLFLVNIGAASTGGGVYDPTYPVLRAFNRSFGALLIDPNPDPSLFNAYPKRDNIRITHDSIWADTVVQDILIRYNVPKDFALLKLDIDSYECSVLESIMSAGYRPVLIHTEFNPIFPPPVRFAPLYDPATKQSWTPSLWMNNGPFYGCSLSALTAVLSSFDYVLVQVEFWDVIYVQQSVARSTGLQVAGNDEVAYEHGFVGHPCLPFCRKNVKLCNDQIGAAIRSSLNASSSSSSSSFAELMKPVIDSYAPRLSSNKERRHPYTVAV